MMSDNHEPIGLEYYDFTEIKYYGFKSEENYR